MKTEKIKNKDLKNQFQTKSSQKTNNLTKSKVKSSKKKLGTGLSSLLSKDQELASIIKSSKFFIGNLSFGYALAEALKIPRLLESGPNFPLVYPNGPNAYDFYFQKHFETLVKKLYND